MLSELIMSAAMVCGQVGAADRLVAGRGYPRGEDARPADLCARRTGR